MNYGKKKAAKRQKDVTSKTAMKKKRIGVRLFKALLITFLFVCVLGIVGGGLFFKKMIDNSPKITPEDVKPSKFTSVAMANDGTTVLDNFVDAGSNRAYKPINEIPVDLQNAFIAIEDSRFREHNGIDLKGIIRAGLKGILSFGNFSEGASTLTQQLIKNNVFPNFTEEKTFMDRVERKLQEQYLALEIEKQMSKDQILENYLNTINLGQNTLGVQVASKRYFNKDVSELTLSESAAIAAITQNPGRYNPVTNPEENAKRRKKVLDDMQEQDFITQAQHDEALADPVYDRIQAINAAYEDESSVSSYFIDEVSKQVTRDLRNHLGYSETQAYNALYSGGLTIVTTQDVNMQAIAEEELNNDANYPNRIEWGVSCAITITHPDGTQENFDHNGMQKYVEATHGDKYGLTYSSQEQANAMVDEYISTLMTQEGDTVDKRVKLSPQPQASVVIMDQATGHVKAIVGGRGPKTENRSLNRATQSTRQPGSCFKILATYAPALDTHGDTLATVIEDAPFQYDSGKQVNNWWGDSYRGNLTIRKCIEISANVCTVKKFTEITPSLGFKYLTENFALTTLDPQQDIVQSATLGGISRGVTNLEMTAAYAAIANKGTYTEPILYTKIFDHEGNLLFEKTPETHVALKETTAGLLTNAMQDVITGSEGTGRQGKLSNMPVSGKTGTTQKSGDLWFSAYTPYLTASVWTGYDDLKPMQNIRDQSFHIRIWRNIMQRIHEGYEYKDFPMPNSIEKKTICTESGNLASSEECQKLTEYFAPGTAPTQSCPGHIVEVEPPVETPPSEGTTSEPPSANQPNNTTQNNNQQNGNSDQNNGSQGNESTDNDSQNGNSQGGTSQGTTPDDGTVTPPAQ